MTGHREPEVRRLLGARQRNDDGFTYRYGAHKGGFVKRSRHAAGIARCKRSDKRGARAAALLRLARES